MKTVRSSTPSDIVVNTGEAKASSIAKITISQSDGTETVYNVDENTHFLYGILQITPGKETEVPIEIAVKGSVEMCGRLFYMIGEGHQDLVLYCAERAQLRVFEEKVAGLANGSTH